MYNAYLEHGCPQPCTSACYRRGTENKINIYLCETEVSLNQKYFAFYLELELPSGAAESQRPAAAVYREGIGGGRRRRFLTILHANKKICGKVKKKYLKLLPHLSFL